MGGPITIEDRDTIVLAYSGGQQDVDEARIGTILGRQVPVHYRDAIAATGVFEKLRTSDEVIVLDLPEEHMVARAVIAVRNDNRLTGSIWAAIRSEEHTSELQSLMRILYAVFCLQKKNTVKTNVTLTSKLQHN